MVFFFLCKVFYFSREVIISLFEIVFLVGLFLWIYLGLVLFGVGECGLNILVDLFCFEVCFDRRYVLVFE